MELISFYSIKCVLKIGQILGLFPYDFTNFARSSWTLVTLVLLVTVSAASTVLLFEEHVFSYDRFISVLTKTIFLISWLSSVMFLLGSLMIGPHLMKYRDHLIVVEKRLLDFGENSNRKINLRLICDAAVRVLMLSGGIVAHYFFTLEKPIFKFLLRLVVLFLTNFLQNVYEIQFLVFINHLADWFKLLRKRLVATTVNSLIDCHKELVAASDALEKAFSLQNFVIVSNCFTLWVIYLYLLFGAAPSFLSAFTIQVTLELLLRVYRIVVLCFSTGYVTNQAQKFDVNLYTIVMEDQTERLISNAKVREHLFKKNAVVFTGASVFQLERPLAHTLTALTANSVVLLIQLAGLNHKLTE